jgi:hypothetical protein
MKRIAFLLALQVSVLSLSAAEPPKECALCVGAVSDLQVAPATPVPLLVRLRPEDFATAGTALDAMPPAVRAKVTIVISYAAQKDPMAEVERTQSLDDWARSRPVRRLGISVECRPTVSGYAIKRLAVTAQGQGRVANRASADPDALAKLYETGAQSYVDMLLADAPNVKSTAAWVLEKIRPEDLGHRGRSRRMCSSVARALADGATRAFTAPATADLQASLASFDRALIGEYAYDATARIDMLGAGQQGRRAGGGLRGGEDLRTVIVPRGDATASTIVARRRRLQESATLRCGR